MYPVADCHLGTFLEDTSDLNGSIDDMYYIRRLYFLASTLACLTSAVAFIHKHTTKHMDIKPQNILVRAEDSSELTNHWRIYLADFGLSRSFASQDHSQTDGPTSRTPRCCAPEIYQYEQRGRSADVFSLGCVFLEILTVYEGLELQEFADQRRGDGMDESFHANLERVYAWTENALRNRARSHTRSDISLEKTPRVIIDIVERMVAEQPHQRPPASVLSSFFWSLPLFDSFTPKLSSFTPKGCCMNPPEPYETYHPQGSETILLPDSQTLRRRESA